MIRVSFFLPCSLAEAAQAVTLVAPAVEAAIDDICRNFETADHAALLQTAREIARQLGTATVETADHAVKRDSVASMVSLSRVLRERRSFLPAASARAAADALFRAADKLSRELWRVEDVAPWCVRDPANDTDPDDGPTTPRGAA
jgi:hypothetical protein